MDTQHGRTFWDVLVTHTNKLGATLIGLLAFVLLSLVTLLMFGLSPTYDSQNGFRLQRRAQSGLHGIRMSIGEDFIAPSDGFVFINTTERGNGRVWVEDADGRETFIRTGPVDGQRSAMIPVSKAMKIRSEGKGATIRFFSLE